MQNCRYIILYSFIIQLTVYKRTMARFIADDTVVYQGVRRATQLASGNSWARRHLKHFSWRSRWIVLCTLEHGMPVSRKIAWTNRFLFGLSSWLSRGSSFATCRTRSAAAWLPDNCTRLIASLQQSIDASKFGTPVGKFTQQPSCAIPLWQMEIFNQNRIFLWNFHDFILIFTAILGLDSFLR